MWNERIDKVLEGIGFVRLHSDHGVYVFGEGDGRLFIALYVDDLLIVWKIREALDHVKGKLKGKFDMKDLGTETFLLGGKRKAICSWCKRSMLRWYFKKLGWSIARRCRHLLSQAVF